MFIELTDLRVKKKENVITLLSTLTIFHFIKNDHNYKKTITYLRVADISVIL